MQVVIDIPEELYKEYVNVDLGRGNGKTIVYTLLKAIKKGTPLPANHGRLIDLDALIEKEMLGGYIEINDKDICEIPIIVEGVKADEKI